MVHMWMGHVANMRGHGTGIIGSWHTYETAIASVYTCHGTQYAHVNLCEYNFLAVTVYVRN